MGWPMSSIRWRMSGRVLPDQTLGMLIVPCSGRTLAELASGVTTTLLTRAADVSLKERRCLVMMVREAPLHGVHIRNMLTVTNRASLRLRSVLGARTAKRQPLFKTAGCWA